jgi:hypothetical protein
MMGRGNSAMMRIEIVKRDDGCGVLRCTRADGTVAWQKQAKHAAYFSLHDLTHFAVETTLGYGRGFFGLLAEGWGFEDITGKGPRGKLPDEALEVESIVGLFDRERFSRVLLSAAEFSEFSPRALTEGEIVRVRAVRAELFKRWSEVPPGGSLRLLFGSGEVLAAPGNGTSRD